MANLESNSIISNPNDYERLVRFVTREGADFALCLVQYRDPNIRDKIMNKLEFDAKQLGVLIKTLDFGELDHNANLLEEMQKGLVQENTQVKALSIKRLDLAIVDAMGNPRISPSIQGLNLARDQIPKAVPARVVLWLSEAACNALATNTTDFYDVIYSFYQFDDQEPPRMIQHYLDAQNWQNISLAQDIPKLKREVMLLKNTIETNVEISSHADALARIGQIEILLGESHTGLGRLEKAAELYRSLDQKTDEIHLFLQIGDFYNLQGQLETANTNFQKAKEIASQLQNSALIAESNDRLANVLFIQGKFDEALEIFEKQILPVFEALGDIRSVAVARGKIADILFSRGKLDEALEIHEKQALPVFEALGDILSVAVARGKIADILFSRGKLDEALEIHEKHELPIYESLGDVREATLTRSKIANILWHIGHQNKSIEIYRHDVLPVFLRLGDKRAILMSQYNFAQMLIARRKVEDFSEVLQLLRAAFKAADEMGIPEADEIMKTLQPLLPKELLEGLLNL